MLKIDPTRGLVLLAVNVDVGTMDGQFSFKSSDIPPPKFGQLHVMFEGTPGDVATEGRALDVTETSDGWSFVDHFGGFGSHVYVLA